MSGVANHHRPSRKARHWPTNSCKRNPRSNGLGEFSRPGAPHARRYARLHPEHSRAAVVAADSRCRAGALLLSCAAPRRRPRPGSWRVHARVLPYAQGNVHPGFMGWVNGAAQPWAWWRRCSLPAELQSRRPRSYSDRGRAAGYALGGRAFWISGRGRLDYLLLERRWRI